MDKCLNQLKNTAKIVSVSPLVLLSIVDHYNIASKNSKGRVVGVILGETTSDKIKVTNSYAIPFEEDEKDPNVWFLDHNFIEVMGAMFRKINASEKLVGWYHSGPKLKSSDLKINELFKKYNPNPLLLVVDVTPRDVGTPTNAYFSVDDIKNDGSAAEKTFVHVQSLIESEEAEEVGVEHLLRNIKDSVPGNLSVKINEIHGSLLCLNQKLKSIRNYLDKVYQKKLPINHTVLGKLQNIFNLLFNLTHSNSSIYLLISDSNSVDHHKSKNGSKNELIEAFTLKTNDELMMVYISTLVRAIIAFHNLVENKLENKKLSINQNTENFKLSNSNKKKN